MPRPPKDLRNFKKGYLTVLYRVENDHRDKPQWLVECVCGTRKKLRSSAILGGVRSCGCKRSEAIAKAKTTHGHGQKIAGRSRTYRCWIAMRQRCSDQKAANYERYGGRGIRVCDRWQIFENFLKDMGEAPSDLHTVDRKDPNGDYEPNNCEWATTLEQLENRRHGLNSDAVRFIRAHPTLKLKELSEKFGVTEAAVSMVRLGKTWAHVQ